MNGFPWLTLLTVLPLIGAIVVVGLDAGRKALARIIALGFSILALMVATALWFWFDRASGEFQFVERHAWIPSLNTDYFLGLDGLGLVMILLTALVMPMAMLVSLRNEEKVALQLSLFLLLEAGLFGTFTALNFIHWFLFWELSLVPAFFLVHMWGGAERSTASIQFFVYTMVGSIALLLAFLGLYLATGSFDFSQLAELARTGELKSALSVKLGWYSLTDDQLAAAVFFLAFVGFAVKIPIFPFHTWLPLTYAEAPSSVTMVLTGLMSKMGVYGFLRVLLPIFPEQLRALQTPLLTLCVLSIVLSAFAALAQRDLKRLLAYSSINHLGYCVLGVMAGASVIGGDRGVQANQAAALSGVILQMFNHGLTAATLFCFVAFLEQRTGGLRGLNDFGGLRQPVPVFCGLLGIALFSSLGLPGLNGFIGEFLIFKGAFPLVPWAAGLSLIGLLITAIFLLTLLQRVFSGPLAERWKTMPDLNGSERAIVIPAVGLMFVVGIYPQLLLELTNATVLAWLRPAGY